MQAKMLHNYLHSVPCQVCGQLLCQVYRAVLSAGAAEGDHQALEPAPLIIAHSGINERDDTGEKLMDAHLLAQIVDHRRVLASKFLETWFASRIGKAASIEDESAAMTGIVLRG